MKILVVAALPNELKAIKEWIKSAWIRTNLDIDYLSCGIWNYESIFSLEHYMTENNRLLFGIFEFVIIGILEKKKNLVQFKLLQWLIFTLIKSW